MKQIQKGFTLIELMIVVAIIGILAAVAIPAYQDYVIKSKLSKVQSTLDALKTAFTLYYQENSGFPNDSPGTVTYAVSSQHVALPLPPPDTTWTSIGLKMVPDLSKEMQDLTYTPSGNVVGNQAVSMEIVITLINIKATAPAIDATTLQMVPVGMGSTAIQWDYSCTSLEPLLLKYFKRPDGSDCSQAPLVF